MNSSRVDTSIIEIFAIRLQGDRPEFLTVHRPPNVNKSGTEWQVLHGKAHDGESFVQCARREVMEELGVRPRRIFNLLEVDCYYNAASDRLVLSPIFVAEIDWGDEIQLSSEHDGCKWLTFEEVPSLLHGHQAVVISRIHRHFAMHERILIDSPDNQDA
jgi:8-oxo-dGTP pyrophosphatase MutT (NUDIX family)